MHHHAFGDWRGAGGRRSGAALDLDQAKPAGAEGLDHVGGAELRDLPAELDGHAHDGGAIRNRDRHAVDGERHRLLCFGTRGAEIDFVNQRHLRGPHSAASRRFGEAPKSSGKWVSALITGYGVKPPSAHSEPNFMVLHKSSSTVMFLARSSSAMILSTSSTPRADPMRQGVHLPQDSIAQNSMAKRAWRPMFTVSSNTTMPPWPISPSAAVKAS